MSYNKDTDYQAKINDAVKKGDYESAAKYEKSRNEKIDGEGLSVAKTNNYSGWLDKTDYSNVIRNQISTGASRKDVADTLKKRIQKASGTQGLSQYAYDDVYDAAVRYIRGSDFSYAERAPQYRDSYSDDISELIREIRNIRDFKYNPQEDELYKYYQEQYKREGKRAMEDLLGELSANTGGIASSYAATAASQSLDYYNKKMTDKIPELYSKAFDKYLEEIGIKEKQLSILGELSDKEYSKYLDALKQYNTEREFSYDAYIESLENEYRQREEERDILRDERDYELQLQKLEDERQEEMRKEEQDKIDNALLKWKQSGILDKEGAEILGLPEGLHTSDYDYKKAQQYKLYSR